MSGREESQFLRGEIGIDGLATEEDRDEADLERGAAVDALAKNRAYLGREMLTWLLWRSAGGDPIAEHEGVPIKVLLVGKVTLRGLAGEATELAVKGHMSAYSAVVRHAIDLGLLVHVTRLHIEHGEHTYEVTLDAEHLDFRSANLPRVLGEGDDERRTERLWLCERLDALVDTLWAAFMDVRVSPKWEKKEVPALKEWLRDT